MKKVMILMLIAMLLSGSAMAQDNPPMGNLPAGMPPSGFGGGPGSRHKDIKYTGATTLTATATETGKA